jgi:hypothetical protein
MRYRLLLQLGFPISNINGGVPHVAKALQFS